MTLFILEDLEKPTQRKLFSILGTEYVATAMAWLNFPMMIVAGTGAAILAAPIDGIVNQILVGLIYGLLIVLASFCHGLGHILSSRFVGAPMTRLIATATVHTTHYDNQDVTKQQHIGRAMGGPVFNLLLGGIILAINAATLQNHFLYFFAAINLLFVVITMMPLPSLDGAILVREMRNGVE